MQFPYGTAALVILVIACGCAVTMLFDAASAQRRPDLVFATFVKEHATQYEKVLPEFERKHGVNVQLQLVSQRALQGRLQAAMQAGAEVPDVVELMYNTMGTFTRGKLDGVGFVDLTQKVHDTLIDGRPLFDALVNSRFSLWSSRGHIYALPHDVHPVMLVYRKDLIEQMGIDVSKLTTWDEFCRVGREVVAKNTTPDGVVKHYMIDLQADGSDYLRMLAQQNGLELFDEQGRVAFDNDAMADVVCWYVKQMQGPQRIAFACGWGQTLSRAMIDGLCLFYICPDWRTGMIEADIPQLKGKLGLMPLPPWSDGGRRTSTWGGAGLAITRQSKQQQLAWELAMFLYYDKQNLGQRFGGTNIITPLKAGWDLPEYNKPSEFFPGVALGRTYGDLAPQVPSTISSPYTTLVGGKLGSAFQDAILYYAARRDDGFREYVKAQLRVRADEARRVTARNRFINSPNGGEQ